MAGYAFAIAIAIARPPYELGPHEAARPRSSRATARWPSASRAGAWKDIAVTVVGAWQTSYRIHGRRCKLRVGSRTDAAPIGRYSEIPGGPFSPFAVQDTGTPAGCPL